MNNKTIEAAVWAAIENLNTDGECFERVRNVVQLELETQIDKSRKCGEMIDSNPIMEDINIDFHCSYAPDDAKKPNMRETLKTLADYLDETHQESIQQEHSMQCGHKDEPADWHKKEEPECTYCRAIARARELLK